MHSIIFPKKVAYWSEVARNATETDFRSSKMAADGQFVDKIPQKLKLSIDLKWWDHTKLDHKGNIWAYLINSQLNSYMK